MKYLVLSLLILACENPIDHFTEGPDKGTNIILPACDTTKTPRDTLACR